MDKAQTKRDTTESCFLDYQNKQQDIKIPTES